MPRLLRVALVAVTLIILASVAILFHTSTELATDDLKVAKSQQVDAALSRVLMTTIEAESAQRGFVVTGSEPYLEPYHAAVQSLPLALANLERLVQDNPVQAVATRNLVPAIDHLLARMRDVIDLRRKQGFAAAETAIESDVGRQQLNVVRSMINDMQTVESERLRERSERSRASARTADLAFGVVTVVDAFTMVGAILMLARHLKRRARAEAELKASEATVRKTNDKLQVILRSVSDGIYGLDRSGCATFVNASAARLTGYLEDESLGRVEHELIHHAHADGTPYPVADCCIYKALYDGKVHRVDDEVFWRKDGTSFPVEYSASPLVEDGQVTGAVVVFHDISERHKAELMLRDNERRFREMADGIPCHVWTTDPAGAVNYCNARWFDYTGLSAAETYGWSWIGAVSPQDRPRTIEVWEDALKTGTVHEVLQRIRRHDGEFHWHITVAEPVHDHDGNVVRWIGTNIDVHDRMLAQEAYRKSQDRIGRLLETDVVGIAFTDPAGRVLEANARFYGMTGLPHGDGAVGRLDTVLRKPDAPQISLEPFAAEGQTVEALLHREGRSDLPVLYSSSCLTGTEQVHAVFLLDDSERIAAAGAREQALVSERKAREEAERLNRAKDEFLLTLSHELRTPLNAILGWTQVLQQSQVDSATSAKALATIERSTRTEARLVDDLIDAAQIASGTFQLDREPVDVDEVVRAAIELVQPTAAAKGVKLRVDHVECGAQVLGDARRLQQALWNLLANAVKFTPAGGLVDVSCRHDGKLAIVVVHDTGIGIAPEFLPQAFERFRQADGSLTRPYAGLGIGLSLVRELITRHGGTVGLQSPGEGQGTTATVTLPLR